MRYIGSPMTNCRSKCLDVAIHLSINVKGNMNKNFTFILFILKNKKSYIFIILFKSFLENKIFYAILKMLQVAYRILLCNLTTMN